MEDNLLTMEQRMEELIKDPLNNLIPKDFFKVQGRMLLINLPKGLWEMIDDAHSQADNDLKDIYITELLSEVICKTLTKAVLEMGKIK